MGGKSILLRDKELANWWVAVARDERFERVCALARAELFEADLTPERLKGANDVIATLTQFADNEATAKKFPNPGLRHQMPERVPINQKEKT